MADLQECPPVYRLARFNPDLSGSLRSGARASKGTLRSEESASRLNGFIILAIVVITYPANGQEVTKDLPLAPRVFTFSAECTTAASVAEALAKQTGLAIDLLAIDGNMPVKIDCAKTEFWKAVDMLAEQTKSRVVIGKQGKPVRLLPLGERVRNPVSVDVPSESQRRRSKHGSICKREKRSTT